MSLVANLVYLIGAVLYLPVLAYQMLAQRKNRRGWGQRFGHVPPFSADRPRIWIHAVSLGEVNATPRLAKALCERLPDHELVISTTTDTGYARACALYPIERVFRYPLDLSWVIARVLDRVRPSLIVLVELEVWYNLVAAAARRGIPVAVVNGRLTERSMRRFRRLGGLGRSMFARLSWVGAQDEVIADRFRRVGVPPDRLAVTGSVKWDTAQIADRMEGADALADALGIKPDRPLWVCGSTGPGEEAMILDAYRRARAVIPDLALAVIPRKPERFDEVAELIRRVGFRCIRRSERPDRSRCDESEGSGPIGGPSADIEGRVIFLGDTMGELRKFYSLATAVFVGRSLVPLGGSDPMEVAALAKPVIVGPHMENFAMPVEKLAAATAVRIVHNPDELADEIVCLTRDSALAQQLGRSARQVVLDQQGATERTVAALIDLVRH